jgi:hypothetical protein
MLYTYDVRVITVGKRSFAVYIYVFNFDTDVVINDGKKIKPTNVEKKKEKPFELVSTIIVLQLCCTAGV